MARNGAGQMQLVAGNPVVTNTTISSTVNNNTQSDIANEITNSLPRDGQAPPTANLPMGGFKLTGLAAGAMAGDSVRYEQVGALAAAQIDAAPSKATPVNADEIPLLDSASSFSLAKLTWTNLKTTLWSTITAMTAAFNEAQGANIASASTTNIGAATGNSLTVTGTTPIAAFDSVQAGTRRIVTFSGILTLTYNATSLILPTAANITTQVGDVVTFVSLGSGNWFCVSYLRADGTSLTTVPITRSALSGLTLSTAGASATMSIAAGQAADSTNAVLMSLAATSKTTAAWAVGAANGGLDTGTIANSTWYHFYVIRRPDTGVVDAIFSLSASAPTLPANYTQYRRIGAGLTNGSAQWTSFIQDGDLFQWLTPVEDIGTSNQGTAAVTATLSVPSGINVIANMAVSMANGASAAGAYFSDLATNDLAPSLTLAPLGQLFINGVANGQVGCQIAIRTNTSKQIRTRLLSSDASTVLRGSTMSWIDRRGRDA